MAPKQPAYDHTGYIVRWIDADTVVILTDRGFRDWSEKDYRLYGIQATDPADPAATARVNELLPKNTLVYFKTFKQRESKPAVGNTQATEKYGRYLAEIYLDDGTVLNYRLVQEGHAVVKHYT